MQIWFYGNLQVCISLLPTPQHVMFFRNNVPLTLTVPWIPLFNKFFIVNATKEAPHSSIIHSDLVQVLMLQQEKLKHS